MTLQNNKNDLEYYEMTQAWMLNMMLEALNDTYLSLFNQTTSYTYVFLNGTGL